MMEVFGRRPNCAQHSSRSFYGELEIYTVWTRTCLKVLEFTFDILDSMFRCPTLGRSSTCGPYQSLRPPQFRCLRCAKGGAYGARKCTTLLFRPQRALRVVSRIEVKPGGPLCPVSNNAG